MFRPVCGTNGKTYTNECLLNHESCRTRSNIEVRSNGRCPEQPDDDDDDDAVKLGGLRSNSQEEEEENPDAIGEKSCSV